MPRFNPSTGEALMGVAGSRPSVDGVLKGPVGATSPTAWYDSDNILHQVAGALSKTNIRTNITTTVGGAINELSGGKSKYLGWNSTTGLFGAVTLPLGGINRAITDGRGIISQDGCLTWVPVRATTSVTKVKHPTKTTEVELPDAYGMHLLKWGQGVWNDPTDATKLAFWGTSCAYIPGAQYGKIAKIGTDLWIVYAHPTLGLIAHKAISPTVYHTITTGLAFHPDAISYGGKLAVCYSTTSGETSTDLVKVMDVIGTKPTTAVPVNIVAGGAIVGPTVPPDDLPTKIDLEVFPQFADLKIVLAQTKTQTENPLYQVVQQIIERLDQFKGASVDGIGQVAEAATTGSKNVNGRFAAPTYHTKENEKAILPNSVRLLAGTGITFDDTVANQRTIKSTATGGTSNHYDSPLTDGNKTEADLIYANGECIIVQVPNP